MSGETTTCPGCGAPGGSPAIGDAGEAVCATCGAPLGDGPAPDDTAAFQRFVAAAGPEREGRGRWFGRLRGRS